MSHSAAWIKEKHAKVQVGPAETPSPGPGELLVRVQIIAFSPIESKQQTVHIYPCDYPNIFGFSLAGTVESVGEGVSDFAVGDRVASFRRNQNVGDARFGSFQQFALASANATSKLSPSVSFEAGAATGLNLETVASGLSIHQGLDIPSLTDTPAPKKGEKVLIYGGTSSCGSLAISYARAAGYDVVTTSSPKHLDYIKSLDPAVIIDHTASHEDIVAKLKSNGPYQGIFDCIGTPPVTSILAEYVSSVGGGKYNTVIPDYANTPLPDNVQRQFESYRWDSPKLSPDQGKDWFYKHLVSRGLESGIIKPNRTQHVPGGLSQLQHALDLMDRNEISGYKLVLNPWE